MSGLTAEIDRLAAAALTDAGAQLTMTLSLDVIRAEMAAEDPHAALRADVLSSVVAAGHDPAELRHEIELHGVDLARMAPALAPASDFHARHRPAIDAHREREITTGGFRNLPSYMASWQRSPPTTPSLHDTEHALVCHVVGDMITSVDDDGRDVHEAHRMWQRAADRAAIRESSTAPGRSDHELDVEQLGRPPEQQLELGLHGDVENDVDAGHDAEQEVG